jgi:hypothetical protein
VSGHLPLTGNYPTTQPLTWPFLIALVELRRLGETATHGNQLEQKIWLKIFLAHSSVVTMATGNNSTPRHRDLGMEVHEARITLCKH